MMTCDMPVVLDAEDLGAQVLTCGASDAEVLVDVGLHGVLLGENAGLGCASAAEGESTRSRPPSNLRSSLHESARSSHGIHTALGRLAKTTREGSAMPLPLEVHMGTKKVIGLVAAALIAGLVLGSFGIAQAGSTAAQEAGCRSVRLGDRGLPERRQRHLRQGR